LWLKFHYRCNSYTGKKIHRYKYYDYLNRDRDFLIQRHFQQVKEQFDVYKLINKRQKSMTRFDQSSINFDPWKSKGIVKKNVSFVDGWRYQNVSKKIVYTGCLQYMQ